MKLPATISFTTVVDSENPRYTTVTATVLYKDGAKKIITNTYEDFAPLRTILADFERAIQNDVSLDTLSVPATLGIDGKGQLRDARVSVEMGADGAITQREGYVYLTKAGVGIMTLADATDGVDDNKELTVMDVAGHAHTLAGGTVGFNAAAADGTFDGNKGSSITFKAYKGVWYVVAKNGVTLA